MSAAVAEKPEKIKPISPERQREYEQRALQIQDRLESVATRVEALVHARRRGCRWEMRPKGWALVDPHGDVLWQDEPRERKPIYGTDL